MSLAKQPPWGVPDVPVGGGRELPIEAHVVGARLTLPLDQEVQLTGPELLHLVIQQTG